ncbi:MAG: glycosyltransferase family 2 protein [Candidatus Omnitrophica bacterium]|nr:glycosyltransferase family 2 protein [Candidatus Omnitrophota bacterium]
MTQRHERSLSIVIPAFNEEGNIRSAIDSVIHAVKPLVDAYQVIVIDDGSRDRTREVALEKAKSDSSVMVISNDGNKGFGFSFKRGVNLAEMEYVTVFPGDNDMAGESLAKLVKEIGDTDLVISYMSKVNKRSMFRRIVSRTFIVLMNTLFGLKLEYYNGAFICRTEVLKSIPMKSVGLATLAECLVRMIKSGYSYKSIYFDHVGRRTEKSKAFKIKNVVAVVSTIGILIKDIYFSAPLSEKKICSTS